MGKGSSQKSPSNQAVGSGQDQLGQLNGAPGGLNGSNPNSGFSSLTINNVNLDIGNSPNQKSGSALNPFTQRLNNPTRI